MHLKNKRFMRLKKTLAWRGVVSGSRWIELIILMHHNCDPIFNKNYLRTKKCNIEKPFIP